MNINDISNRTEQILKEWAENKEKYFKAKEYTAEDIMAGKIDPEIFYRVNTTFDLESIVQQMLITNVLLLELYEFFVQKKDIKQEE